MPFFAKYPPEATFGGGSSITADQGLPNTDANAWPVRITDGTHDALVTVAGALKVDASASTQPVSGTVTVIQPTGTNLHAVIDSSALPTGASTAANQATEIASLASIDSKLTSPITVTGPLTDTQLRASAVPVSAASLPLPSGAATSANQTTEIASLASIDGKLNSLGQKTSAASVPVVIASDQSAIPISGTITATNSANGNTGSAVPAQATQVGGSDGTNLRAVKVSATGVVSVDGSAVTQPVSGPLTDTQLRATPVPVSGTVSTGGLTDTQLRASPVPVSLTSTTITGSVAVTGPLTDTQLRATAVPVSLTSTTITGTVAATQSGTWTVQPGNTANTTAWLVSETTSGTSTLSNVASSATSVSILASNAARKGMTVFNDSTQVLYLKLGATASATSYTVQIGALGYYELPFPKVYTGAIDGIWASANGNARVTELS